MNSFDMISDYRGMYHLAEGERSLPPGDHPVENHVGERLHFDAGGFFKTIAFENAASSDSIRCAEPVIAREP